MMPELGYSWCRVVYRPLWQKLLGRQDPLSLRLLRVGSITGVPLHRTGFDEHAMSLVERGANEDGVVVIAGHPGAISRSGPESLASLERFLGAVGELRRQGLVRIDTVSGAIAEAVP